jgi:hypothetical protein
MKVNFWVFVFAVLTIVSCKTKNKENIGRSTIAIPDLSGFKCDTTPIKPSKAGNIHYAGVARAIKNNSEWAGFPKMFFDRTQKTGNIKINELRDNIGMQIGALSISNIPISKIRMTQRQRRYV